MPAEQPLDVDFIKDAPPQILPNLPLLTSFQSSWRNIHLAHHRQPAWELPEIQNPQHVLVIPLPLGDQLVEVSWVSEGRWGQTQFDGNDYTSHIQIFPAHVPYGGSWSQNIEFIHFYLEPAFISQLAYESINPDKVEFLLELKKADHLIHQIGLALRTDLELDGGNGFYADSLATALSAHLLKHYATRKHVLRSYDDGLPKDKLNVAIDYINTHLGKKILLADMAAKLHISQYHFCRMFKQSTGMSPHHYLMQQRVEQAKQLLGKPERTVTHIALECGFNNQSHFAKYFRRYTGVSPTRFRELM
ncbi:MAG: helix-turn-helix transcriptional regulator [Leptolyngbyaceae cyanobacterium SU_3_3]|nr:helix-turn-helix transcriptional regulator [Leptolyngbyaceae cyanobacterium SU_3_3]NJR51720.1 helix-turn-helix transcriptional regulator [Leptolyngbyaceae cyanobacterium CSU_1_3]